MNRKSLRRYLPPPGPILSLLLIGLVLLSAIIYYRAVKIQRFLEPALALSQPRNEFANNINTIFQKEFGQKSIPGLTIKSSSILIEKSLFFTRNGYLKASSENDISRLGRIFLTLMRDDHARSEISVILIIGRFPSLGAMGSSVDERLKVQRMVGFLQDALFQVVPELGIGYARYFVAAAQPINPHEGKGELVELRIVPSEYLHIEVLEKLEKYSD